VEFLEAFEPPCYKIASPEIVDLPLIRRCATTARPLIISTGMASITDIGEAVNTARQAGCTSITLLKCTTDYPADPKDANIRTIPHLAETFDCRVGLSDHTLGIGVAVAAVALGASMIEKHLTLNREDGGPDSHFSLEPLEMERLVTESTAAWSSLGAVKYGPTDSERGYLSARRSLYITADMQAGDVFSESNIRSVRPGLGLSPKYRDIILGKRIKKGVLAGTPVSWDLIS
jgi:sialic acid synthase SpsE